MYVRPVKRKARIAIFASGRGSNAQMIHSYSQNEDCHYEVVSILSNRKNAGVIDFARTEGIPSYTFHKEEFYSVSKVLEILKRERTDLIVLAGFLWLIPESLVHAYPKRILNIHPALLPKYGGKGMYGKYVHEAVKKNGDPVSGMTIHFVNEKYDEGQMIFQAQCQLNPGDEATDIARKVLRLEHHYYPRIVDGVSSRLS